MSQISVSLLTERMESLGLTSMAASFESYLGHPARHEQPLVEAIADLLETESIPRAERKARMRLKLSGIPQEKGLDEFDLDWLQGGLSKKTFAELSSLAFIDRRENVVLMGPSGLGKTHLLLALGAKACREGYTAYYITAMDLLERLSRAREQGKLKSRLKWFCKPHLLLMDEVGYQNLTPEQATLFFQLVNARYESGSIIMTTNKTFGKWGEIMADDAVATATLDRLLHHVHIVSLQGDSYRMKDRMKLGVVDFL